MRLHKPGLRIEWLLFLPGVSALLLGLLMYIATRPCQQILLLHFLPPMHITLPWSSIALVHSLPSFLHIYGFILMTAAVLPRRRDILLYICGFWLLLELLFEMGQQQQLAKAFAAALPPVFHQNAWLRVLPDYFVYGTFDPQDILLLVLGSLAAWGTVRIRDRYLAK
jgi:hypothetical protein